MPLCYLIGKELFLTLSCICLEENASNLNLCLKQVTKTLKNLKSEMFFFVL